MVSKGSRAPGGAQPRLSRGREGRPHQVATAEFQCAGAQGSLAGDVAELLEVTVELVHARRTAAGAHAV